MTYTLQNMPIAETPPQEALPPDRGLRQWLWLLLGTVVIMIARPILWRLGVRIPQQTIASGLAVVTLLILAAFARRVFRTEGRIVSVNGFSGKILILALWVGVLTAWGVFRGNIPGSA